MTPKKIPLLTKFAVWKIQTQAVILLLISFSCLPFSSAGKADELDKAMLKAIYTYKFGKFTHWPDTKLNLKTGKFNYCILGVSPFSQSVMDMITGKTIQDVPLAIEVFESGLIPEEVLSACHIIFISKSEKYRLFTLFKRLKKRPVLTVSDIDNFSSQGGMITLTEEQGRLRFQINPSALERADMSISSKIMELAEIIDDGQRL